MNKMKTMSGSSRDKIGATPKQNKWADPFYAKARGIEPHMLFSHKVDSIRESISGSINTSPNKGFFERIISAVTGFFRRKVIA